MGMRHVGSEFGALAHHRTAPPAHVSGRAPLGGIALGLGQQPAPHQDGPLVRRTFLVLRFPPLQGLHREGRAQDKGAPFPLTQLGAPLPGEEALHRHDQVLARGSNDA